ncbi:acetyltransferase [Paenibacillus chibensis]|uniref:acetyltransferase n=1 Tax=Paenibacillus chibensis TaxID=59846 RepID=UPI000FD784F8|nr:acetyltransferase [Paenibacillus chibensis]MEC0370793.1 acetyltransferase [Paenibacillus chibensis]
MSYIIVGAGGHAKVIFDILIAQQKEIEGFIDDYCTESPIETVPVLGTTDQMDGILDNFPESKYIVAIGSNRLRKSLVTKLSSYSVQFGTAIHPAAVIGSGVQMGDGSVIMANVVVNSGAVIGEHAILNTACTVDHECILHDFVHISPGAHLAGNVKVGSEAQIGIGASVIQGIEIGAKTVVGAGACVVRDLPPNIVAVGCPARKMKTNTK